MIAISPSGARVIKYDPRKKENCMIIIKYDVILALIVIIGRVAPLLSVVLLLSFNSLFSEGLPLLACSLARRGGGAALGPWPPARERLHAIGASLASLAATCKLLGFSYSAKKTSCFPYEINLVKSAIFF